MFFFSWILIMLKRNVNVIDMEKISAGAKTKILIINVILKPIGLMSANYREQLVNQI